MGPAAELQRVRPGPDHPHPLSVLVVEERQRPERLGLGLRRLDDLDRGVGQDVGVGRLGHLRQLLGAQGLGMREVEAQPVRGHQRTLLADVVPEHRAQGAVEQVRPGVVPARGVAASDVDHRQCVLEGEDLALLDDGPVDDEPGEHALGVEDPGPARFGGDDTGVAHLATGLGVERGLVQDDLRRAGLGAGEDRHHPGGLLVVLVAGEARSGPTCSSSSR